MKVFNLETTDLPPSSDDFDRRVDAGDLETRECDLLEVRVIQTPKGPALEGYAAVFNQPSKTMFDRKTNRAFIEQVKPGAFRRSLAGKSEIMALVGHDPKQLIGTTANGSLTLREDPKGLYVRIIPPNTAQGRDAITAVKDGYVRGMSFGFKNPVDAWTGSGGVNVRELLDLDLAEVSITPFPAYPTTTVTAGNSPRDHEEPTETTDSTDRLVWNQMRQHLASAGGPSDLPFDPANQAMHFRQALARNSMKECDRTAQLLTMATKPTPTPSPRPARPYKAPTLAEMTARQKAAEAK